MTAQTCPRQHQRTTMEIASLEPSLYTVKAVFILDNDGNRLLSKYYDTELYPSMKEQKNFEKNVFNKTHKADNEIAFVEGMTIVYKCSIDLFFYVVGSAQENELMLMAVLNCLFESLSQILRKNVERRCLLDNMDGVFLVVDEIIDGGVILESDPQQVIQKVNYRADENPLSEQSVAQHITDKLAMTSNVSHSSPSDVGHFESLIYILKYRWIDMKYIEWTHHDCSILVISMCDFQTALYS
ncbi:coatomer subunit zeta-2 isoform 1-T1 [Salvelinus alpinus]